jgi:GAF domain-containing protein
MMAIGRLDQDKQEWSELFSNLIDESMRHGSFYDVSKVIVIYSLKLGFSRAHLFFVPAREDANTNNLMIGITSAGVGCIPDFPHSPLGTSLYPMGEWFDLDETRQSRDAIFLHPDQADEIQKQAEAFGYKWPAGEVACLPLWGNNNLLGALLLDHWQQKIVFNEHERSLINLFARQVAIILGNIISISREKRSIQEMATISHIGRQIMEKADDETNLSKLLEEVREQIDLLMDVSDFAFFLLDPESNELDIRLLYERGMHYKGLPNPAKMEIERFLLTKHAKTIFWPEDVYEHLRKNNIKLEGEIPNSCIGVQLHVGEKIIGGITVKHFEGEEQFTRHDLMLLSSVANQITGAIEIRNLSESRKYRARSEDRLDRQLSVFLCHSKVDKAKVQKLYDLLCDQPSVDPWFDQAKLLPGVDWALEIESAVKTADVVIVCLSKNSLSESGYVHKEIRLALDAADRKPDGTIFIIPLRFDYCSVPDRLSRWQYLDYFAGSQDEFNYLMRSLRKRIEELGLIE